MYKQMADLWIDLMFWWIPKERQPFVAEEASVGSSEIAIREEPAQEGEHLSPPADLTVIKGIGPALQRKLAALNILTFGDLAAADPETLTERLKGSQPISPAKVRAWTESARELAQA
ncbi:MAG: helix-hairpin-helix domain-containing protein [Pseudomonadota bacterium]